MQLPSPKGELLSSHMGVLSPPIKIHSLAESYVTSIFYLTFINLTKTKFVHGILCGIFFSTSVFSLHLQDLALGSKIIASLAGSVQ